VRSKHI